MPILFYMYHISITINNIVKVWEWNLELGVPGLWHYNDNYNKH